MKNLNNLKNISQEILGEDRLEELLQRVEKGEKVYHYIGFEVSGRPHIGHGILCMMVIKELQELGITCRIFIADWHAWLNDKLGGNWELIQGAGLTMFKEYMKAGAIATGVDLEKLEFIEGSKLYASNGGLKFWETFIRVCKSTTLARIQRSIDIMGRKDGEATDFAKLIYPPLQAADIFYMGNHIAHGGMDQRKIHVIAIDIGNDMGYKPVAIHHRLVLGLQAPSKAVLEKLSLGEEIAAEDIKMSKSKPDTAIFMDDSEDEIRRKIKSAYCPEGIVELNPILDWCKNIIFKLNNPRLSQNQKIHIERKEEWGGNVDYTNYESLESDFAEKKLHPMDLKNAVAEYFVDLMRPSFEALNKPEIIALKEEINNAVNKK